MASRLQAVSGGGGLADVSCCASIRAVFTQVYRENRWGNPESRSGFGSTLARSESIRAALKALLERLQVKTLLDAPCGDFNWMQAVDMPGTDYLGVDIVEELIEHNQRRHGAPNRRFQLADITTDTLPPVDLIVCRDGLVHLSNSQAQQALALFEQSGSQFLLSTTFPTKTVNAENTTGDWRPINLEREPFSLSKPLQLIPEGCPVPGYADKALGLWQLAKAERKRAAAPVPGEEVWR